MTWPLISSLTPSSLTPELFASCSSSLFLRALASLPVWRTLADACISAGLALASAFFIKNIKIESPFKAKPAGDDAVEKQETRDSVTEEKA